MKFKRYSMMILSTLIIISAFSCDESNNNNNDDPVIEYPDSLGDSTAVQIVLSDDATTADGESVSINGNIISITTPGNYSISGTLSNGCVIVDCDEDGDLILAFNGVNICCSTGPAMIIENADEIAILLNEGYRNRLEDGSSYSANSDDDPDATLYSKDDLSIYGEGTLIVVGNYADAIKGKDDLYLNADSICVSAADDGIVGRDALVISGGNIIVNAEGDGLKASNDEDSDAGYITISNAILDITASGDGISAETGMSIDDGIYNLTCGGGYNANLASDASAKGLKALTYIEILAGDFDINTADDAIHADGSINIVDGTFSLATGDDAIHADEEIILDGGNTMIADCYEGVESQTITFNDGEWYIISSDDAINVSDGSGSGGGSGPPPGRFGKTTSSSDLTINGGYIYIDCEGDGIDSNGSAEINDGLILVNGPKQNNNGAIDVDETFAMNGGVLIAVGSSGMAETPSSSSSQKSIKVTYNSTQSAGTLFHLQNASGESLVDFSSSKYYSSVVFSSPELTNGSYEIYSGGSCSGTETDGYYEGGTYTAGTNEKSFTISNTITTVSIY